MKELLEAGVHFGHQTQRWNPKMDKFIYGAKSCVHILDLRITYDAIEQAQEYVQKTVANSGKILFVGTKPQAQQVIEDRLCVLECLMLISDGWAVCLQTSKQLSKELFT